MISDDTSDLLGELLSDEISDEKDNQIAMVASWMGGKIGVAYYETETHEMYIVPDTAESAPDFSVLRSIFRQVMPTYLMIKGRIDARFRKVAAELCGENLTTAEDSENATDGDQSTSVQSSPVAKLVQLPAKFFFLDTCKHRLLTVRLPFEAKDISTKEHELFIASLIPFRSLTMVQAAGALLKYLDNKAMELFQIRFQDGQLPVMNIKICTMDDLVIVDDTAWQSLQIFNLDAHPSSNKQACNSGAKEGISVYSMLSQSCCTLQGARSMRLMLLRPSRSLSVLKRRHDVIEFCSSARNIEFVNTVTDCLKSVKSLPKLMYKLHMLHATVVEWKDLYQTLYNCLILCEICSSQPREIDLFRDLADVKYLDQIRRITNEIIRVIDFEESLIANRLVVRTGVDHQLDMKKQQQSCLGEIMTLVAKEEVPDLPEYVDKCCVVYIPEVGYLLAVCVWSANLSDEEMQLDGFEFKFKTNELIYYKSKRTTELDAVLGDCTVAILEKETALMIYLTEHIIKQCSLVLEVGVLVSELDCLLSMSAIGKAKNFVRPEIIPGGSQLRIVEGRHPLVEDICNFVANSTILEDGNTMVIVTGPNASGKSIYLKQIGVIAIMALSGSFVPAAYARIPTFDRICTRIHASESLASGFSSYMIDLSQMSLALRTTTKKSLVIIDEFGKGTAEADGLSLLVASMEEFVRRDESPTVFLSTHFYSLRYYFTNFPGIKMQSMKFVQEVEGEHGITYLYELVDGMCTSSFAHIVAQQTGISKQLIDRNKEIEDVYKRNEDIQPLPPTEDEAKTSSWLEGLANQFLEIEIEDPKEIVEWLQAISIQAQLISAPKTPSSNIS